MDVALLVLETPWDNNEYVSFTYPDPLFDLSLDSSGACYAVSAFDADMVGPEHRLGTAEYLIVPLLW